MLTATSERTFLAWLRTSLAFASIGIAVTQLFRLNTTISEGEGLTPVPSPPGTIRLRQVGKPLGATFLGISILVLIVGGRRYFEAQVSRIGVPIVAGSALWTPLAIYAGSLFRKVIGIGLGETATFGEFAWFRRCELKMC